MRIDTIAPRRYTRAVCTASDGPASNTPARFGGPMTFKRDPLCDVVELGQIAARCREVTFTTVNQVLADPVIQALGLQWKFQPAEQGQIAFAVANGDRETGAVRVYFMLEGGAAAPRHLHRKGEFIVILAGALLDVADDGSELTSGPGTSTVHGWETVHAPAPWPNQPGFHSFVFGFYDQPGGSALVP